MHSIYSLAIIGLAASVIALPVWQAQIRDDVTEYYPTGDNEKRDVEAIDYYYTGDGQKRDDHCSDYYYTGDNEKRDDDCTDYYYTDDNEKRHEARSFVGLELEELD